MNDEAVSTWFKIDEFRFHRGKWMANWRTQVHWTYFHCLFHFVYILHFNDSLRINLNWYGWAGLCFSFRHLKIEWINQIDWRSEAFFVICLEIDGQMEMVFFCFFKNVSLFFVQLLFGICFASRKIERKILSQECAHSIGVHYSLE